MIKESENNHIESIYSLIYKSHDYLKQLKTKICI